MYHGKLLSDEEPLLVFPKLACVIGLNESLILQQIHYWIQINTKTGNNFKDGYYWTYNTYEKWQEQFPFWSVATIKRIIKSLKKAGLLITSNYNRIKIDRTKWYRIDYSKLESLENSPLCQNDTMDDVKLILPIPETNQRPKRKYHQRRKDGKLTKAQLKATAELAQAIANK